MGKGETLVREHLSELENLCRKFGVRKLDLFGSALQADFDQLSSDFDFLVEIEPPPGLSYSDAYFGFQESLQQLFGRSVDLVSIGSVRNPYFLQAIENSKRSLYAA